MIILSLIFGIIGGLCMVMGIVTALGVAPLLHVELTWFFWFVLSGILMLICIAFALGRGEGYEG